MDDTQPGGPTLRSVEIPPPPWRVFEPDGEWWNSDLWHYVRAIAGDRVPLEAAEAALREVFTADWVRAERAAHPPDRFGRGGFDGERPFARLLEGSCFGLGLLEVGWALTVVGGADSTLGARLRSAAGFDAAGLELWVGHMLHEAGAGVTRSMAPRDVKAPDWIATWPRGGQVAIEVKGLQRSEASERRRVVIRMIGDAFGIPPKGLTGMLSVHPSPARLDALVLPELDEVGAWAYAQELAVALREALKTRQEGQLRFDLGALGSADITNWPFPFRVNGGHEDPKHELKRLRSRVRDAAQQLATSGAPGIVVVDLTWHPLRVGAHLEDLDTLLREDPDCQHIAAVLLHTSFVHEHVATRRLHLVAGLAFGDIPVEFWSPFTLCDHENHLHFEPMREPGRPYQCHPW